MAVVFFAIPLFLFAVLLTSMVRKLAMQTQMLAIPTHRSSHSIPTPVGGGIALVLTYCVMLSFVALAYEIGIAELAALAAGLPVAIAGLVDDRAHLSARTRLAIQFSCALFAVWIAGNIPHCRLVTFNLEE